MHPINEAHPARIGKQYVVMPNNEHTLETFPNTALDKLLKDYSLEAIIGALTYRSMTKGSQDVNWVTAYNLWSGRSTLITSKLDVIMPHDGIPTLHVGLEGITHEQTLHSYKLHFKDHSTVTIFDDDGDKEFLLVQRR